MENFDILIYAAVTVFLLSRLWAVLGRRDEEDEQNHRAQILSRRRKHRPVTRKTS
jgi:membrane protein implicated in regulation of membrane protease activity